MNWQ